MDKFTYIANAHGDYIDKLYESYRENPETVDLSWQRFFEGFEFAIQHGNGAVNAPKNNGESPISETEIQVRNLIGAYRSRGHLEANTNPVRKRVDRKARLSLADFELTEADLSKKFVAGKEIGMEGATLREIVARLEKIYKGSIGFEYIYVREPEIANWIREKVEIEYPAYKPSLETKKRILGKLNEAAVFENFLQTKYLGQKRFSLEGGESTIPALDAIINRAADLGVQEVTIGMAHRGRLNVLANIMGKTYNHIFNEFEGGGDFMVLGDGDVKYHMGYSSLVHTATGKEIQLKLSPNPSHLEAVNPVVQGFTRAKVDTIYGGDYGKSLPILIHGDAAIAGQGIVYEVVQMSNLKGYNVGGTIHFVINNQVGFTTDFEDARSSIYSTDITEIVDSPVLHVNGDDPEAVIFAVNLAVEYRQKFQRDIFVDMVCYRRHGHNEADEPKFTQPILYNLISKHPNPRELYNKKLIADGEVGADLAEKMDKEFRAMLQDRFNEIKQQPLPYKYQKFEQEWQSLRMARPDDFHASPITGISSESIEKITHALTNLPEGFKPIRQITRLIKERQKGFYEQKNLNWAMAELLAYGSLLLENKRVRMSGQDVERGTFSHRHAVIHDAETNEAYIMLNHMTENQAKLDIYNSLLSEYGVLGFEFGYAMANPHALVIWEAQFGDFANGAQIMIDQFIASSEAKWQRMTGLVMLLPHGYEGQGPEHSSARPERFLQMCAEENMVIANITTPANFFHLMRRQLHWEFRKPCVVMSPKSLLRHPACASPLEDFAQGTTFREVIGDTYANPEFVNQAFLCTGKVYYDLLETQQEAERQDITIIRLEQLHPFPQKQLTAELQKYPQLQEVLWIQEEPENMGYASFMMWMLKDRLDKIIARPASASPASGYAKVHRMQQEEIVQRAFGNVCEVPY